MKILLAGSTGYVGNIIRVHLEKMYDVTGVSSRCLPDTNNIKCDLQDREAVCRLAENIHPDLIIHAAGNKNIDFCEKNHDEAFRINCDSVRNLAEAFASHCRLIFISTDYVFDGYRGGYTEHDAPSPLTVYGKSKLCGEIEGTRLAVDNFVILRLSAIYDMNATFPRFLYKKLSGNESVECFSDVVYSPTYYKDFLNILDRIIMSGNHKENIFHACGEAMTRYDFALACAEVFGFDTTLVQKTSGVNRGMFLFPDLSMQNEKTQRVLQVKRTGIADALMDMKKERKNETY